MYAFLKAKMYTCAILSHSAKDSWTFETSNLPYKSVKSFQEEDRKKIHQKLSLETKSMPIFMTKTDDKTYTLSNEENGNFSYC